ncbi:MAG: tol-pal system-associated acyl-CoA thioesterase [Alphaproteobacteria bacterium]|jgi:acyl-CoA thioester hydrolase
MSASHETTIPVRVYYEDTDAGGIVYHANYLKFAERGRTEFLRTLGVGQTALRAETGLGFAVANLTIDYRRPAVLDDDLIIRTVVEKVRRASIDFVQTVERGAETLTRLTVRVACIDQDGRPTRMPGSLIDIAAKSTP